MIRRMLSFDGDCQAAVIFSEDRKKRMNSCLGYTCASGPVSTPPAPTDRFISDKIIGEKNSSTKYTIERTSLMIIT